MSDEWNTATWVKQLRMRLKLTQAGLAAKLRVSRRTVKRWEQGKHEPTGPTAARLAALLVDHDMRAEDLATVYGQCSIIEGPDGIHLDTRPVPPLRETETLTITYKEN